ncbi:MAG TPA: NAD(P)-binding domain-containing protein [Terriglobales bacterium]|nr:NAD(P)-binding domain-containing protein [Terriglobales bacterium]
MNPKVTVIGAGRMGSALAAALYKRGSDTTVWNRTSSKTESLSRLGLRVAPSLREAVGNAEIVIVSLSNYEAANHLLRQPAIESALRGKVLVQLSSGTPDEAREMESWARPRGIDYLDGAILGYPVDIGKPQATVLYSGPDELFKRVKPVLLAFGDNTMFVGKEIGNASATDIASLSFAMGTILGFLHGYVVYEAENLPASGYLPIVKQLMPAMEAALADLCNKIQSKDYANTQATLETWAVAPRELIAWCEKHRVNHTFADPQLRLIEQAVKAGKGQMDIAYLYEVLKQGVD